ncbi:flavocytochrome c [Parasutterella excrementihominis]|jgi:urocanate reductase|uniref:flavocytochrome c n=2 Tax=Parasutterella excrementihominis TaxID=487175 RepID=UPI00242C59DF|nr:flavocytochrome c [Parasutterella excrementihominis]
MKLSVIATSVLLAAVSTGAYAYTPGTYTAAIAGQNGPVKVEVTTSADKILSVKIVDQKETEGIGSKAVAALPAEIVKAQSADVQGIAGASVSSAAIKKAVQECLNQAQGKKAAPLALKNGTFEGKAYGNNGWLTVEVTIKDNKITDIKTPGQRETKYLGDTAIREIGKDVLQYQTLNVDNIAGATVTSTALKTAIAQAIEKAGGDIAAFQKSVPEKIKKVAGITKGSADLIIVGAGGAGLSAAVTAKDLGVKNVLVLEKMPVIGGNTLRCASAFNAADPDRQKALPMTETLKEAVVKAISEKPVSEEHAKLMADVKAKYEAYLKSGSKTLFDCPEWHALQTYNGGDKVGHIPLIRQYSNNVLDTLHWMQSKGSPVMDRVSQGAGALWQRTHQLDAPAGLGLIDPLYQSAVKQGVNFKLGMRVQDLILNDKGRVIGVTATDKVGNKYEFTSKDGVILATGGYSQNKEMRQKSAPHLTPEMVSTNQPGATGDGIVIATRHGADTTGMNYVQVYPLATPGTGALQGRARKMSGLDDVIDVNKNGERFVKEDARRDEFVAAIKKQPGGVVYDINDSSIVKPLNSFNEDVETLVSIGRIYKADSLADLAKQLGMPADKLEATVAEFNKMVEAKNDPKFGRKLFDRPIVKPPFYATPRAPSIHHTMGGLQISTNAQVLDKKGKPIPGLYAAGEVTGGIHGSNRLGGNATADVLTFGRIAAKSAVAHK